MVSKKPIAYTVLECSRKSEFTIESEGVAGGTASSLPNLLVALETTGLLPFSSVG